MWEQVQEYMESLVFLDFSSVFSIEQSWITIPVFSYSALILLWIMSKVLKLKSNTLLLIISCLGIIPFMLFAIKDGLPEYMKGYDVIAIVYSMFIFGVVMVAMLFISINIISINKRYAEYTRMYPIKILTFGFFTLLHILNSYYLKDIGSLS